jgi:hypothetical protein
MNPWMKVAHWGLNAVMAAATLALFYFSVFGHGQSVDMFSRIMTAICGVGLGYLTYAFAKYTLKNG